MLDHDRIMKAKLIRFEDGAVIDVDTETNTGQIVFVEGSVAEEYMNLFRSSAVLYQTLSFEREQLQILIQEAKETGAAAIIPIFEQMISPIEFALKIAVDGVEDYIKESRQ